MEKLKRGINLTAVIFSVCFLIITVWRWDKIETIDRLFYGFAVIGLGLLGLSPLFAKKSKIQ